MYDLVFAACPSRSMWRNKKQKACIAAGFSKIQNRARIKNETFSA
jgi:hypothetical protein